MAKKNWWVNLLKNLFICESQTKSKKSKTKGWRWFFDKFSLKQLPTTTHEQNSLSEAKEEQRKHALNVAKATAAAAEAAMAAAQAAVEVVRLTGVSHSCRKLREKETLAATIIQSSFRAYLARKALRALKGVVRIQALARGRAVRRHASKELKHSRSILRSQVIHSHKLHCKNHSGGCEIGENYQSPRMSSSDMLERSKLECKSQRQWTGSLFSKDEIKSLYLRKHEAAIRRERMKQYSFSHRERQCSQMLEETVPFRHNERRTCPRKKWAEENMTALDFHSNTRICDFGGNLRIKPRNLFKEDFVDEVNSPSSYPRRSFCNTRQKPSVDHIDDCQLITSSFNFPTYMAATESAKAKMRSMSTPRQRIGYVDACFEHESTYTSDRPCQWSSYNGDSKTSSVLW